MCGRLTRQHHTHVCNVSWPHFLGSTAFSSSIPGDTEQRKRPMPAQSLVQVPPGVHTSANPREAKKRKLLRDGMSQFSVACEGWNHHRPRTCVDRGTVAGGLSATLLGGWELCRRSQLGNALLCHNCLLVRVWRPDPCAARGHH